MATQNKRMALVCAGLAAFNVLVVAAAQAQGVSFEEALNFPAGSGPQSVAVGDFNGDGVQDLAVANYISNDVSVLLGNGDGSFQAPRNFAVGSRPPLSVAVGDFNRDGRQDLAVANAGTPPFYADGSVSLLLGNGDGTFQLPRNFPAGRRSGSVAVGDFNGDGVQDLAVANWGTLFPPDPGSVSVLLGNGDGTFQLPRNFAAGHTPASVAVGDFNGDGVQDLAVAGGSDTVSVLLGNGDGTFQLPRNFPAGPGSVAVGDFNRDGRQDLVVTNGGSNNVSVLLGNGDGTFQPARNFEVGFAPASVAVSDFSCSPFPLHWRALTPKPVSCSFRGSVTRSRSALRVR